MATLTLRSENPEILLKVQQLIHNLPEIEQKESADLRKARAKAQMMEDLQQAFDYLRAIRRGELKSIPIDELIESLKKEETGYENLNRGYAFF